MRSSKTRVHPAALLLVLAPFAIAAAAPAAEIPEALPVCASPQLLSPEIPLDSGFPGLASIAWNGSEFGVAYPKSYQGAAALFFARFYANGTPVAPPAQINTGFSTNASPWLIWDGGGYALVWQGRPGSFYDIYFMKLNSAGVPTTAPLKASFVGSAGSVSAITPRVATSGADYLVAWVDGRTGNSDVYATLLTGAGAVNGIYHDLALSGSAANTQDAPAIAWSPAYQRYILVWEDNRTAPGKYELYRNSISGDGTLAGTPTLLATGAGNAFSPDLVATGGDFGLTWQDSRDGNTEIYFARLLFDGSRVGADLRLTNDLNSSYFPRVLWTGGEFMIYWTDNRSSGGASACDLFVQRVTPAGAASGVNTQLSTGANVYWADTLGIAYARAGALVSFRPYSAGCSCLGGSELLAIGCSNAASYPTCPDNLLAYSVSGTQATIGWLPSRDTTYDIAFYEVLRDNAAVGRTASGALTDGGLGLNTTYNYAVRAVNAWGGASAGCPSIYVKTSAALTLTLNKQALDADLSWTPIGLNSYSVFRGVSPQLMQKIGATPATSTTDANALANGVSYFYTVDDPGQ